MVISIAVSSCNKIDTSRQSLPGVNPVILSFSFGPFETRHYQGNYAFTMEAEIDEQRKRIHLDKIIPNVTDVLVEVEIPQAAQLTVGGQTYDGPVVSFTFNPSFTTITVAEAGRSQDYLLLTPTKLSTATSATDDTQYIDDGNGGIADAIAIFAEANFEYVRVNPGENFVLVNDITLKNNFEPIAPDTSPQTVDYNGTSFNKIFEGSGKTISNLRIAKNQGYHNIGFFGYIGSGAAVRNLKLILASGDTNNPSVNGGYFTGVLAGRSEGAISHVGVEGGYIRGSENTGGLVGTMDAGSITNSYTTGTISGRPAGGLVGFLYLGSSIGTITIANSYATGAISTRSNTIGGLVGEIYIGSGATGTVEVIRSYFDSALTGQTQGFGGIIGNQGSVTTDITPYYTHTDGQVYTGASGGGREIQQSDFSGWNFTDDWRWLGAGIWPRLAWQQ